MAGEELGEIWAVAGPGSPGPVDVRVYVRGITAYKMHNGDGKTFRTLYPPTKLTKR